MKDVEGFDFSEEESLTTSYNLNSADTKSCDLHKKNKDNFKRLLQL